jgi:hypothetical protein
MVLTMPRPGAAKARLCRWLNELRLPSASTELTGTT